MNGAVCIQETKQKEAVMFDVISRADPAVPRQEGVPLLISIGVHLVMIGAVAAIPLLYVSAELPQVSDMLAFVAAAPPPPPPPPPPPAPRAARAATSAKQIPKAVPSVVRSVPVEAPAEIARTTGDVESGMDEGIPGGVEGGVPGGIPGGVVGGIVTNVVPPPPLPAPVARAPVRVGGAVTVPALVTRIEPVYPPLAVRAQVQGVVILEAVVDQHGEVEKVSVLRSIPLLDRAAMEAVRQWRYSPLLLNGQPERFVLTVTVSFSLNT
jgi:periplasmic protein TonB